MMKYQKMSQNQNIITFESYLDSFVEYIVSYVNATPPEGKIMIPCATWLGSEMSRD